MEVQLSKNIAEIVFLRKKHSSHAQIVAQLLAGNFSVRERSISANENGDCDILFDDVVGVVNLFIVYLSPEIKHAPCLLKLISIATENNIRIVGVWLEDAENSDIPECVDSYADSIVCFSDELADVFLARKNLWTLVDGEKKEIRKIKKHVCG